MAFTIGATDKKYVSAITMLDTREILDSVLDVANDAGLLDILTLAERTKPATQPVYHNFVADSLYILLDSTGATITGSGTAQVVTTFTAATSGFVRKTDLIIFPNGKVGYVTNVTTASSQDTATIKSVNGTNLTHTAGQKLSQFSNAFGERSIQPVNRKYGMTKYLNQIQTFREVNEETDIQTMSTVEVSYKGSNYLIYKELAEKALKLRGDINGAIIGGSLSTTLYSDASPALTDPVNGGAVQTTRGLDEYITTYGVNDTVAATGTWTLTDQADLVSQLLVAKAPKRYLVLRGSKAAIPMDTHLKGLASGGVTSAKLMVDGKTFDYGVESYTYAGFNFQNASMGILDNQEMFSQTNIVKSVYYIPLDSIKGSNGMQPRCGMRYMKHNVAASKNAGNDMIAEWHTGALAPTGATSDEALWRTNWITYQGLECLGVNAFAKQIVLT